MKLSGAPQGGVEPTRWALTGGTIVTPRETISPGTVVIDGAKIAWVGPDAAAETSGVTAALDGQLDVRGALVAPGFIDIHVHGGGGADTMDGTREALACISRVHAAGGTTSFVATTVTAPVPKLTRVARAVTEAVGASLGGAALIGLHLEGPFLAPDQLGAHNPAHRRDPVGEPVEALIESCPSCTRITAAPERPGALELGRMLAERGWHVAMGHSSAVGEEIVHAIGAGYSHVTHLYSCSSGLRIVGGYKTPGINESALLFDELSVELIADGHHLPGALIKLVSKVKGPARTCLITDAMRAAAMPPGEYNLGDMRVVVEDGIAKVADRSKFAGSVATMDVVVRQAVEQAGVSLGDALRMASLTPAELLGLQARKGSIELGKDADIVVLSRSLAVERTIVGGRCVYEAGGGSAA